MVGCLIRLSQEEQEEEEKEEEQEEQQEEEEADMEGNGEAKELLSNKRAEGCMKRRWRPEMRQIRYFTFFTKNHTQI